MRKIRWLCNSTFWRSFLTRFGKSYHCYLLGKIFQPSTFKVIFYFEVLFLLKRMKNYSSIIIILLQICVFWVKCFLFQENHSRPNPVKAAVVYHKPVPNFEKIYSDFQAKMEKTKNSRMLTVIEPFTFDSEVQRVNISSGYHLLEIHLLEKF